MSVAGESADARVRTHEPMRVVAWLGTRRKDIVILVLLLIAWTAGVVLRLVLPGVMEYKGDEQWTFHMARQMVTGGAWPRVGMESSVGVANPGLSIWIFGLLAFVSRATTPVELARAVACMNIVALTGLFVFAWTRKEPTRIAWLWAAALAAVDPLGILQQRKIWPPCTFPLLTLGLFLTWRMRRHRVAAFAWGALGALISQIHMGAVLYVFGFFAWAVYEALRTEDRKPSRWLFWLGGSIVGSLPAIPWIMHFKAGPLAHWTPEASARWGNVWRMWMEDVVGWNLEYSLGPTHMKSFLAYPLLGVRASETSLVKWALWISLAVTAALVLSALWKNAREGRRFLDRFKWDGAVGHNLAFFVYGLGLTLPPLIAWRHYLLVTYPFQALTLPLLAWLGGRNMRWLTIVWIAHAVIAASALQYLFAHHGAPGGDYGTAFEFQGRPD